MRLWTLHPRHLDRQGLLGVWREALLAQAVLSGKTRGYKNHAQLSRFKSQHDPIAAVGAYLRHVRNEAFARGYNFDESRIMDVGQNVVMEETSGQLQHEWFHLMNKLARRSPTMFADALNVKPTSHPLFRIVSGGVRKWEKSCRAEI